MNMQERDESRGSRRGDLPEAIPHRSAGVPLVADSALEQLTLPNRPEFPEKQPSLPKSGEIPTVKEDLAADWLRMHGIKPPNEPDNKDPFEGQDQSQFRFDRSLARLHMIAGSGIGLGVASCIYLSGGSIVATGSELAIDTLEAVAGAAGIFSYSKTHLHLLKTAYPNSPSVGSGHAFTPGYADGIGQAAIPSVLLAGMGFSLLETGTPSNLAILTAGAALLAGYHWLRHSRFWR